MKSSWKNRVIALLFLSLSSLSLTTPTRANDEELYKRSRDFASLTIKVESMELAYLGDCLFRLEAKLVGLRQEIEKATEDSKALAALFEHDNSSSLIGRNNWYLRKDTRQELQKIAIDLTTILKKHQNKGFVKRFLSLLKDRLCGSMAVDWMSGQPADSLPKALTKLNTIVEELIERTKALNTYLRKDTGDYRCLRPYELKGLNRLMHETRDYLTKVILPLAQADCKDSLQGKGTFKSVSHSKEDYLNGWYLSNPYHAKVKSLQRRGYSFAVVAEHSGFPQAYAFWGNLNVILKQLRMDNFNANAKKGAEAALELRLHIESLINKFNKEIATLEQANIGIYLSNREDPAAAPYTDLLGVVEDKVVESKPLQNTIFDGPELEEFSTDTHSPTMVPTDSKELAKIIQRMRQLFIKAGWDEKDIPTTFTRDGLYQALLRSNSVNPEKKSDIEYNIFQLPLPQLPEVKSVDNTL